MKELLKYSEWQDGVDRWHCNDVSKLSGIGSLWWVPCRMLEMTPVDYIKWLRATYAPDHMSFDGKTLLFSWDKDNYSKCHAFVLYINRIARNKKFFV